MPAHIGSFAKLQLFGAFIRVNLDPRDRAKQVREQRVGAKNLRNQRARTPDAPNNRAEYVPLKHVMQAAEQTLRRREREIRDYPTLRGLLDRLNPAQPYQDGALYTDQREWELYFRPGTEFDGNCQLYLESGRGPMLVIVHNKERLKLKRIEALPRNSKPVILWSDAA